MDGAEGGCGHRDSHSLGLSHWEEVLKCKPQGGYRALRQGDQPLVASVSLWLGIAEEDFGMEDRRV